MTNQPTQTHTWCVSPTHHAPHKSAGGRGEGDAPSIQVLQDTTTCRQGQAADQAPHLPCTAGLPRVIEESSHYTTLLLSYLEDTHRAPDVVVQWPNLQHAKPRMPFLAQPAANSTQVISPSLCPWCVQLLESIPVLHACVSPAQRPRCATVRAHPRSCKRSLLQAPCSCHPSTACEVCRVNFSRQAEQAELPPQGRQNQLLL